MDRYQRQIRFTPLGEAGQQRLLASRALICGCGALGSVHANTLARAGVGRLRIVDRDFVELSNLQRQVLFDEDDVAQGLPKSIAAAAKLSRINATLELEPIVADVGPENILELLEGVDVVLDGTDNFETRYLINDATRQRGIPWVYGGCLGAEGQTMTILPGETPCLRCLMPDPPPPGTSPTCDTAGILGPIINVIASVQAAEAMKILSGHRGEVNRHLTVIDLWDNRWRQMNLAALTDRSACPTCSGSDYPWLNAARTTRSAVLCGRNSVQLTPAARLELSLPDLAQKLAAVGRVTTNPFLVRCQVGEYLLTVFADGRAIIGGTEDIAAARAVYAQYIGN